MIQEQDVFTKRGRKVPPKGKCRRIFVAAGIIPKWKWMNLLKGKVPKGNQRKRGRNGAKRKNGSKNQLREPPKSPKQIMNLFGGGKRRKGGRRGKKGGRGGKNRRRNF